MKKLCNVKAKLGQSFISFLRADPPLNSIHLILLLVLLVVLVSVLFSCFSSCCYYFGIKDNFLHNLNSLAIKSYTLYGFWVKGNIYIYSHT